MGLAQARLNNHTTKELFQERMCMWDQRNTKPHQAFCKKIQKEEVSQLHYYIGSMSKYDIFMYTTASNANEMTKI